jgi:formate-dependent phosphoribosylglycinamide formyltransferase (GAR transformylase)
MPAQGMRGDRQKVIVEEFINFEFEITLLTIRQRNGPTLFCPPIGHVQERGDYQYSWQPASHEARVISKPPKTWPKKSPPIWAVQVCLASNFL